MGVCTDAIDRVMKLRELFNKAGEGKTKLSVNDFSESIYHYNSTS